MSKEEKMPPPTKPPRESGNFASKAHDMIEYLDENNPEVAGWNESGDTIVIHSSAHMEQEYLPRYFDHNNMQSFVRQLNLYGFRNVSKEMTGNVNGSNNSASSANSGNGILAFRNPHFVKGQKDLVRSIKRSTTGDRAQRKSRQDEALRVVSGELKGRLDAMEADVTSLHHKVDEVSSKLDLVIGMLSSAGIGTTSPSMNAPMNGATPQAPPPSYAVASPRTATNSEAAIDGWLQNVLVAGQKRNRSGQVSQKRQYKTARTRTGDGGKKVISSEGSMSSGDSDQEGKADQRIANNKHMFYDVHSGQHVASPLDESRPDMFDTYDDFELDPETSSVLLTLDEERSMEDPEAGNRSLQLETAGGGLSTEPIPFDAEHMELPDIVLADDQGPGQSASVNMPPPDQAQQGPLRKFVGTHRNIVLAGLMVTTIVAAAVGAGLSTQATRNSSPQPGSVADTMTYGPEPQFEQPEDMTEISHGGDFSEEEAGKMADTNIMVSAPPPNADETADYGFEEDYAADYESVAPESLPEAAPQTSVPAKQKPVGGGGDGGGGSEFAAPASAADTAEYEEEADTSTPPRDIDSSMSLVGTVVRRSGMPTAQPTAPPTAEPTLSVTSSRLLGTFYGYSSPIGTPTPAPHHFLKQHRFG
mmetsp:Transcript_7193/g.15690  ORF Transcript_7193/g.15690 Transcript_7193/m.15690 type:complete len:644 (-) Transcript_7193:159-2090(-)